MRLETCRKNKRKIRKRKFCLCFSLKIDWGFPNSVPQNGLQLRPMSPKSWCNCLPYPQKVGANAPPTPKKLVQLHPLPPKGGCNGLPCPKVNPKKWAQLRPLSPESGCNCVACLQRVGAIARGAGAVAPVQAQLLLLPPKPGVPGKSARSSWECQRRFWECHDNIRSPGRHLRLDLHRSYTERRHRQGQRPLLTHTTSFGFFDLGLNGGRQHRHAPMT